MEKESCLVCHHKEHSEKFEDRQSKEMSTMSGTRNYPDTRFRTIAISDLHMLASVVLVSACVSQSLDVISVKDALTPNWAPSRKAQWKQNSQKHGRK